MKTTKLLVGDYELLSVGGAFVTADPLLVYIMEAGKDEKIVWRSKPGDFEASFRVPMTAATKGYWMCVQNSSHGPDSHEDEPEHPDLISRTVGLSFRVQSIHEKPAPLAFTEQHQNEWNERSGSVEEELRMLVNHHDYMRMREADHRMVVENTFGNVLFWTLTEASLVVLVAVGQVMYFRRFLERKTFIS